MSLKKIANCTGKTLYAAVLASAALFASGCGNYEEANNALKRGYDRANASLQAEKPALAQGQLEAAVDTACSLAEIGDISLLPHAKKVDSLHQVASQRKDSAESVNSSE